MLTFWVRHWDELLRLPLTLSFISGFGTARTSFQFSIGARGQLGVPGQAKAIWVRDYLAATRKWIVVCAIAPLFLLDAPVEFVSFTPTMVLFHLAFGVTLSILLMELMFHGFRKVPFTCAYLPGKINLVALTVIYVFGFTMYSNTMASLEGWLEGKPLAAAAFFTAGWLGYAFLTRWRDSRLTAIVALDYEDEGDPVVRTLDLSA